MICSTRHEALRIATNGVSLHVVAAGPPDRRLVVLLHGFPEFWYGWRRQIAPLAAAGFRVVAPDQRGYNLSDKPQGVVAYRLDTLAGDIIGLADALGHQRFAVVGHDWGAVVAWHLASRHPDRIERAAILNGPHPATMLGHIRRHPRQALKSWYIGFFQLPLLPEFSLSAGNFRMLRRTLARTAMPGGFVPEDWPLYQTAWGRPGALTAMLNWYRALPYSLRSAAASRIRVPVRILWGERDAFLASSLAESAAALCDAAEITHLPDNSHWVQHEDPGRINALLIGFLTQAQ